MSWARRFACVGSAIVVVAVLVPAPPAAASVEGPLNNFFGTGAGASIAGGTENSFFGGNAGNATTSGSANTFVGRSAGRLNTTGASNAFFGAFAGDANTTGLRNSYFGREAGKNNSTGQDNAFFGREAGLNSTGSLNSFLGAAAGINTTTGNRNTFLGTGAGGFNGAGGANTAVGADTEFGGPSLVNATALGHRAVVSQDNSLVLGSISGVNEATSDVQVGIGTTTPQFALHVRRADGTAKVLVEEASPTLAGRELFQLSNNGAARFRLTNTSNGAVWDFQSSSGAGSFVIDRVGGPVSLDFEIKTNGDAVHAGSVTATSFITSSDRTKKTDITPAKASKLMALLSQLDISTWRFKDEPEGTINLGPMAQDFHRLFGMGTDTTIDIRDLAALALLGVQALDERLANVEATVRD